MTENVHGFPGGAAGPTFQKPRSPQNTIQLGMEPGVLLSPRTSRENHFAQCGSSSLVRDEAKLDCRSKKPRRRSLRGILAILVPMGRCTTTICWLHDLLIHMTC
eukprot:5559492-Prorocentrum_lima.AAC.1